MPNIATITGNTIADSGTAITALQPTITLTTTGSSGAATLISNTLNIPQYSGGGGSTSFLQVALISQVFG
jgi:hypothetical protein